MAPPTAPAVAGAVPASAVVVGAGDGLAERLLERRVVVRHGHLDADAVNRAVAELALLDATGDEPVRLQLTQVGADLGEALTLVDALDLVGVPVHATALGVLTGPAVALLAVADRRVLGAHATVRLCEPRAPHGVSSRAVEAEAAERVRQLRLLQERIAAACGRPVDDLVADMRAGRLLDAAEAHAYGLADAAELVR